MPSWEIRNEYDETGIFRRSPTKTYGRKSKKSKSAVEIGRRAPVRHGFFEERISPERTVPPERRKSPKIRHVRPPVREEESSAESWPSLNCVVDSHTKECHHVWYNCDECSAIKKRSGERYGRHPYLDSSEEEDLEVTLGNLHL